MNTGCDLWFSGETDTAEPMGLECSLCALCEVGWGCSFLRFYVFTNCFMRCSYVIILLFIYCFQPKMLGLLLKLSPMFGLTYYITWAYLGLSLKCWHCKKYKGCIRNLKMPPKWMRIISRLHYVLRHDEIIVFYWLAEWGRIDWLFMMTTVGTLKIQIRFGAKWLALKNIRFE